MREGSDRDAPIEPAAAIDFAVDPDVPMDPAEAESSARTAAALLWPDAMDTLTRYADLLSTVGLERGLLGPREVPRIWNRHVLNCAVVALDTEGVSGALVRGASDPRGLVPGGSIPGGLVPSGASVLDVGSGAGLPGLVWALIRPDLESVILLEPLLRRAAFLSELIETLGCASRVSVRRARAEESVGVLSADVVTARAVAPLDRLVGWTLPLARVGGAVAALKGSGARAEVPGAQMAVDRWGGGEPEVVQCGQGILEPPTSVVLIRRTTAGTGAPLVRNGAGNPPRRSGRRHR